METTNLDKIKEIFKTLLELKPIPKNEIFVSHPFLNTRVVMTKNETIDIFENPGGFKELKEAIKRRIEKTQTTYSLFSFVEKPYRLSVFSYTCDYMNDEDYGNVLNLCWTTEEFNSNNPDITKKEMVSLFKKANPNFFSCFYCLCPKIKLIIIQNSYFRRVHFGLQGRTITGSTYSDSKGHPPNKEGDLLLNIRLYYLNNLVLFH